MTSFASNQTSKVTSFVNGKASEALTGLKEAFADGKTFVNRANNNIKQIILPQGDLALPGGGRLSGGTHYLDEVADTGKNVSKIVGEGAEKASGLDGKLIRDYVKDIESRTGRELNKSQLEKIKEALRNKEYTKLSPSETKIHRRKFNNIKDSLIDEWEIETGQKWPRYGEDLISENTGKFLRRKGDPYDAHHIIENSFGGEHEWWNIHPAKFPNEHQAGIHGAGSPANELFK